MGSSFPPMRITTVLGLRNDRCNPTSSCVLDSSSVNDSLDAEVNDDESTTTFPSRYCNTGYYARVRGMHKWLALRRVPRLDIAQDIMVSLVWDKTGLYKRKNNNLFQKRGGHSDGHY